MSGGFNLCRAFQQDRPQGETGPGSGRPRQGLSYSPLDIGRAAWEECTESAPSPRAADGLGPRREPPQLPTVFSSFPRVATHRIGSLYVKAGGGDRPGRVVRVALGGGFDLVPKTQELAQQECRYLSLDQGDGWGPRGMDGTGFGGRVGRGCEADQLCPGGIRVAHTQLGYFWSGQDQSKNSSHRPREGRQGVCSVSLVARGLWLLVLCLLICLRRPTGQP